MMFLGIGANMAPANAEVIETIEDLTRSKFQCIVFFRKFWRLILKSKLLCIHEFYSHSK